MTLMVDRIGDTVVSCTTGMVKKEEIIALAEQLAAENTAFYIAGAEGDVALDSASRNALFELLRKKGIRVLAVCDSKVVRGIVTAATWMGVRAQSMSWQDIQGHVANDVALDLLVRQRSACHA